MDKRKSKDKGEVKKGKSSKKVVDLTVYRAEKTEEKRREYERVLFHRVLGVYSFVEKQNLAHVEVLDISYSGVLFRELHPDPAFKPGAKVALRFYFTPSSYLRPRGRRLNACAISRAADGKAWSMGVSWTKAQSRTKSCVS